MLISDSRRKHARRLLFALVALGLSATVFYFIQNASSGRGGDVAPVKVLWLLTVIVFWYLLPLCWATDRTLSAQIKGACRVFALNMLLRAGVEIWMMYVTENWLHSYGIAHDIASLILCLALVVYVRKCEVWAPVFFAYCAVLFAIEAVFASYLRKVADADGSVFFLPSLPDHKAIMIATGTAVGISAIVGLGLIRKWLHATPSFNSTGH